MNVIKLFIANIRRKFFNWRIEREIFHRIFPQLRNEGNFGYPFQTKNDLVREHLRNNLQAGLNLRQIGYVAAQMPKAKGDAFRYIVYRDLNERMEMYLALAKESDLPESCDTQPVTAPA